jgi:hypothetical protein
MQDTRKQEKLDNLGTGRANYNSLNKKQKKKINK